MKNPLLLIFILFVTSCTSTKVNLALKLIGAYNNKIKLDKVTKLDKEVIFIPMIHIGTEPFYNDVKNKIDSLENCGYITYYEKVNSKPNDTTNLRKLRKLLGFPVPKRDKGYISVFDSIYKFKLKKKLISQPKYKDLGVDSLKGKNVDLTLIEVIDEFERRFGEINLNECDFKTSPHQKTICDDKPIFKENVNEIIINYRNKHVFQEIILDEHKKIILIYGKKHFIGIEEKLIKLGFLNK
jgi:hypothetical protein